MERRSPRELRAGDAVVFLAVTTDRRCLWATRAIDRQPDLQTGRGSDSSTGHTHNDLILATAARPAG